MCKEQKPIVCYEIYLINRIQLVANVRHAYTLLIIINGVFTGTVAPLIVMRQVDVSRETISRIGISLISRYPSCFDREIDKNNYRIYFVKFINMSCS